MERKAGSYSLFSASGQQFTWSGVGVSGTTLTPSELQSRFGDKPLKF